MNLRKFTTAGSLLLAALTLVACAGGPVPPDWQASAHASLNAFSSAYLVGNSRVAEAEFKRARADLTRTGRADLVARAELVRCGVRVASLEFDNCPGFAALAQDTDAAEQAYAAFLANQPTDAALLPPQYHGLSGDSLNAIEAPLPRLIAAGVLYNSGRLPPAGIQIAVDTASAQGWRRPLLAWLGIQAQRAEASGQQELAASLRRRIELVGGQR